MVSVLYFFFVFFSGDGHITSMARGHTKDTRRSSLPPFLILIPTTVTFSYTASEKFKITPRPSAPLCRRPRRREGSARSSIFSISPPAPKVERNARPSHLPPSPSPSLHSRHPLSLSLPSLHQRTTNSQLGVQSQHLLNPPRINRYGSFCPTIISWYHS